MRDLNMEFEVVKLYITNSIYLATILIGYSLILIENKKNHFFQPLI